VHLRGVLTHQHPHTGRTRIGERRRVPDVAARDLVAGLGEEHRERRHARTAHADEVDPERMRQIDRGEIALGELHETASAVRCDLVHQRGHGVGGVSAGDRRGGRSHPGERSRILAEPFDLGVETGVQFLVPQQDRSTGVHEPTGVGGLVVLGGQRPRRQDRRKTDGGELGHAGGSGARHGEVCGGVQQWHAVLERDHLVGEPAGGTGTNAAALRRPTT
jgi:hypothetical protein